MKYSFHKGGALIQVYRYSFIIYQIETPLKAFPAEKQKTIRWCKEFGFLYIRERVNLELKRELRARP